MVELQAALADRVAGWRTEGYPTDRFPAVAEILEFATEDHDGEAPGTGTLRYFTGAITDPKKTDLVFAYQRDGRTHSYTPDFVVHASDDRWMLVEVKMTARRNDPVEGQAGVKAAALQDLEARNPGRVFFKIVFADDVIAAPDVAAVAHFLGEEAG